MSIGDLERKIVAVDSALILLAIAAIAGGDWMLGRELSLGYLYLIPLSYSALTHRMATTLGLILLCVVLRQWLGPIQYATWVMMIRDWGLTAVFLSLVATLQRLGSERRSFFDRARRQRDELTEEVRLAATVQQKLLTRNVPPTERFDITARMVPARVVGGDYYDFVELPGDRLALVIADVSGKGLPAALLMPAVQIALRTLANRDLKIEEIVREVDRVLYDALEGLRYATLFYGHLHLVSGRLDYVNCGHLPPLLLSRETHRIRQLREGGPPLGLLQGSRFETGSVQLAPGDLLFLYTDGIVEAESADLEEFGQKRLEEVLNTSQGEDTEALVDRVYESVEAFSGGASQRDDMTAIVIRRPIRERSGLSPAKAEGTRHPDPAARLPG